MKFKASENLIDLFVGQLVYSSPATPVRELLQNAHDACVLQSVDHSDFQPSIIFRISRSGNWFEVDDNGIGMGKEIVEESFSMVGRPKTEVPSLKDLIQRGGLQAAQIATFGVGVLSCFRVAQRVKVSTKMEGQEPIAFIIEDPRKDFVEVNDGLRGARGTTVKVEISSGSFTANDAYNAVFHFARHVDGLKIEDMETSQSQLVSQKYDGENYQAKDVLRDERIRFGILALNDSWESPAAQWNNLMGLDSAGFLVTNHDLAMLPAYCFGYTAEIDFIPQKLNLMVNRENFVQDEKYNAVRTFLLSQYFNLLERKIKETTTKLSQSALEGNYKSMFKEQLLTLEHNLPSDPQAQNLRVLIAGVLENHVDFQLYGPTPKSMTLLEIRNSMGDTFYIYYPGRTGAQQATETFDEETTLQVTRQTLTAEKLKANFLSLQGKPVFVTAPSNRVVNTPSGNYSLGYDLISFLNRYASSRNIRLVDIAQVPDSEVKLQDTKLTDLMSAVLSYPKKLKFMYLAEMKRPTFRDIDGSYWVNMASSEVRSLMKTVPDLVGNPIKKELLLVYFDLLTVEFSSARQRVEKLLLRKDFEELSRQRTGLFQELYLRKFLSEIASIESGSDS